MKKINKLLLIRWGQFENELISFDDVTFLFGKTGSGKSTIVDALEMVLTADTKGSYFNKAANEQSERTLKAYLRGDTGATILRKEEDFTSYVVMEIRDDLRKQSFLAGCAFDCFANQEKDIKKQWFIMQPQELNETLFLDQELCTYNIAQLKIQYKDKLRCYHTNKDYLNQLYVMLGNLNAEKYIAAFHKALSFNPRCGIQQFIMEYVCQVDDTQDRNSMEKLKDNIRRYTELKKEGELNLEKIEKLQEIHDHHKQYQKLQKNRLVSEYMIQLLELEKLKNNKKKNETTLKSYHTRKENLERQNVEIEHEIQSMTQRMHQLESEYHGLDVTQTKKALTNSLCGIQHQINESNQRIDRAYTNMKRHGMMLADKIMDAVNHKIPFDEQLKIYQEMKCLNRLDIYNFPFEQAFEVSQQCQLTAQQYLMACDQKTKQLDAERVELKQQISKLKKNINPFPRTVLIMKDRLEEALKKIHKKNIEIMILSDLLEIKDEQWRNAIEGYLNHQKFYLMVPGEYYKEALYIYRKLCNDSKIYGIGLLDEEQLLKSEPVCRENSLAAVIDTKHPAARKYIDYLMGQVIRCKKLSELTAHKISITTDAILYKSFVTSKIDPKKYEFPYIGKHAIELNLKKQQELLKEKEKEYDQYHKLSDLMKSIVDTYKICQLSKNEIDEYKKAVSEKDVLERLVKEQKVKQQQLDSLDLSVCVKLKNEINALQESIQKKSVLKGKNEQMIENNNQGISNLMNHELPTLTKQIEEKGNEILKNAWSESITVQGMDRIKAKMENHIKLEDLVQQIEKEHEEYQKHEKERFQLLISQREAYNTKYKMSFNSRSEENEKFDQELHRLNEIRFQEYDSKIEIAKQKANETFRYDFIGKMRNKLQTVKRQIRELNSALENATFGKDRYRFVTSVKKEYKIYYDMFMDDLLLDGQGWNLGSEQFNQKYKNEMEILFNSITPSEAVSTQDELNQAKAIAKWMDFSTYLTFDLEVTNENGQKQLLSQTLAKKSGGETQTPLYISMLASFAQICKTLSYHGYENDRFSLIVLDEAFSKMDDGRIGESVDLLRKFGLQAIFSAPDQKLKSFAGKVDYNVQVLKENDRSYTVLFDGKGLPEK